MFLLSKVLWLLLQPSSLLFVCGLVGFVLLRRRAYLGRVLLGLSLGVTAAVALLPVGALLAWPLETRFAAPELPERVDGIIVLGGAVDPRLTAAHNQVSLNAAAERMTEGLRLAQRYPDARLVFSGGSGELVPAALSEAEVARRFFLELGLPAAQLTLENQSRNTYENALLSRALVRPLEGEVWLLVTSAWHMPRAVGVFARLGWQVIPYPVDYRGGPRTLGSNAGLAQAVADVDLLVREWVGLVAYRLLGYSTSFFPAG